MASKTPTKFCRLLRYIIELDRDFVTAVEDTCQGYLFKPARGSTGVTFLYPVDKAYRKKIIDGTFTADPETSIEMIKSLVIIGYYPSTADFNGGVINALHQKIEITSADDKTATLANGLTITKDTKFIPMGSRENMAVYKLEGKGMIPLDGESVEVEAKKPKRISGGFHPGYGKKQLQKLLEDKYRDEIGHSENIYVKKVVYHLRLLQKNGVSAQKLINYLGNDEISDSYLLDMYCQENCGDCFKTLYTCLQPEHEIRAAQNTREKYIAERRNLLGSENHNDTVVRKPEIFHGIRGPIELRAAVRKIYQNDEKRLGKDLLIVFCNVSKDVWISDIPFDAGLDDYLQFSYVMRNIYTSPEVIANQGIDAALVLTIFGNLLKSDVLNYKPQAEHKTSTLRIVEKIPSPLEMTQYSLCCLVNTYKEVKTGGNADVAFLLGQ